MAKVNSLLTERFKKATDALSKMTHLVEKSSAGNLSSFSGVFKVSELTSQEKETLLSLLTHYKGEEGDLKEDLFQLAALTAEVKAINNQAIMLHGERIKRAQSLLKNYREGAFSAWLIATYGNRQTPYNFLQYFELRTSIQIELQPKLDEMPRQVVYSLASREGEIEKKAEIIKNYQNESKEALLQLIRETFPLADRDQRAQDLSDSAIRALAKLHSQLSTSSFSPSGKQKQQMLQLLKQLKTLVQDT